MVVPMAVNDGFRFACRVYNYAWVVLPSPLFFGLEEHAWVMSNEDPEEFVVCFEELLFTIYGGYYDMVIDEIL